MFLIMKFLFNSKSGWNSYETLLVYAIMKSKILVVEDEEIGRVTVEMILEDDYNLIFAHNGKEAVSKYFSEK